MHDLDLPQRLHFAESDFLAALENGTTSLASYYQTWSKLPDILHIASKTGSVGHETLSLAHSVASRILNIASCYLHVKEGEDDFSARLRVDCDVMVQQMDALNLNAQPKSSQSDSSLDTHSLALPTTPALDAGSALPFPAPAYRWLLDHLHNPYPTAEVKARIAAALSCQVASISSWFVNARRRIGWTTLCRERFSNCRADMIDAAYRALVKEDPQRALSPELRHSFVAMKVTVEGLYSLTFSRTAFPADLDAIVKDMMHESRKFVGVGKCSQVDKVNPTKVRETES